MRQGQITSAPITVGSAMIAVLLSGCIDWSSLYDEVPDPPPEAELVGNIVFFSFNENRPTIFNRAPTLHNAEPIDAARVAAGRFGAARDFDDDDEAATPQSSALNIPDSPQLFTGNRITIEAWVELDELQDQVIYTDYNGAMVPNVEAGLELTADGELSFTTNANCGTTFILTSTGAALTTGVYTHVAVTWDGKEVVFYRDGNAVTAMPLTRTPCEYSFRTYRVGKRAGGINAFDGRIDELKVSDWPKRQVDIQASMNFDSEAAGPLCGDRVIEGPETCEGDVACCDAATCRIAADGAGCDGGTCRDGVCQVAGARVTADQVALYTFDEGAGTTVGDSSGITPALPLTIADIAAVTWGTGTLTIDTATLIASATAATKIIDSCVTSGELTVEAWVVPADAAQSGPAAIASVSASSNERNFTLGQSGGSYVGRVRSQPSATGTPDVTSLSEDVQIALTHIVLTRTASGERRLYVNGRLRSVDFVVGDTSTWDPMARFAVANELTSNRPWLGTYHLVAVYSRALSATEVAQNYVAGAD